MRKKPLQVEKIQLIFIGVLMTIICPGKGCDNNQTDVLSDFQDAESPKIIDSAVKMQTTPDCKNIIVTNHIIKGHIFDDKGKNITVRKRESNKAKRELLKKKEGKIGKVRNRRRKEREHRRKKHYNEAYDEEAIDWADQNDFIVKSKFEKRSTMNKYTLIRNNKYRDDVSTRSKADLLLEILKNYNRRSTSNLTLNKQSTEIDSYEEITEVTPDPVNEPIDYRKMIRMVKQKARTHRNLGYDRLDLKDNYDMLTIHEFLLTSQKFKFLPRKEISKQFLSNKNQIYFKSNPPRLYSTSIFPSNKDISRGPNVKLLRKIKALTSEPPEEPKSVKSKQTKGTRKGKLKSTQNTIPTIPIHYELEDLGRSGGDRGRAAPRTGFEPSPQQRAADEQHDKVMDILKMLGIVILVFAGLLLMVCGALLCCRRKKMCLVYILKAFKSPRYRDYNQGRNQGRGCCSKPDPCPPPCPPPRPPPCPPCIPLCPPTDCFCSPVKLCNRNVCCNYCQAPENNYPIAAKDHHSRRKPGFSFRPFPTRQSYRKR